MKEVIREYGRSLLGLLIGAAMITFLQNRVLRMPDVFLTAEVSTQEEWENNAFDRWMSDPFPEIAEPPETLPVGEPVAVEELIRLQEEDDGRNDSGNAGYELISLLDREGNPVPVTTINGKDTFQFPAEGEYDLRINLISSSGRKLPVQLVLLVNREP